MQTHFLAFWAYYVFPWYTWKTNVVSLCQTEDSCSVRKEDNRSLAEQRTHGFPPTKISAALKNHPKAAHAISAEASLYHSSPPHQPSCNHPLVWARLLSALWQEPQQEKFLYQVCQASQDARVWANMKISKNQQIDVLPPATETPSKDLLFDSCVHRKSFALGVEGGGRPLGSLTREKTFNLSASYVLGSLPYHLVSAKIYCFIRGDSTNKSRSSLLWFSQWNDFHVEPVTFFSLGKATFNAAKEQGKHLLGKRQEQAYISEGIFL